MPDEEILTVDELAERLKTDVQWVYEKRRPRCPNPIPALPLGRGTLRFKWSAVCAWLDKIASDDVESLAQRRNRTPRPRRNLNAARKKKLAQLIKDAKRMVNDADIQAFFAGVERDEDGTLLCNPDPAAKRRK